MTGGSIYSLAKKSVGNYSKQSMMDDLINSDGVKGLLKATLRQLKEEPYCRYAVLKIPKLFQKFKALESTLQIVTKEDCIEFLKGNSKNKEALCGFADFYLRKKGRSKELLRILGYLEDAGSTIKKQMKAENVSELERIVDLIKKGDLKRLQQYFDDKAAIYSMMTGFADKQLAQELGQQAYRERVQQLSDEKVVIKYLATPGKVSTTHWNPLTFALFYQKVDIAKFLLTHSDVNPRHCLLQPFRVKT